MTPAAIGEIERTEMMQKLIDTLCRKPDPTLVKCVYPDGTDFPATKTDVVDSAERVRGNIDATLTRQMRILMTVMASFTLITWTLLTINALT